MTREDITKQFPEATDEQITALLNQHNKEVTREKGRADQYKEDAKRVSELEKKLDEINQQGLSDVEKAVKATEDANKRAAELEKKIARMEQMRGLAEKGITGEDAEKLISEDGNIDFEVLGKIIADRESAAAVKKEQEIANAATNPGGSTSDDNDDKSTAEKLAAGMYGSKEKQNDVLSHYLGGNANV